MKRIFYTLFQIDIEKKPVSWLNWCVDDILTGVNSVNSFGNRTTGCSLEGRLATGQKSRTVEDCMESALHNQVQRESPSHQESRRVEGMLGRTDRVPIDGNDSGLSHYGCQNRDSTSEERIEEGNHILLPSTHPTH